MGIEINVYLECDAETCSHSEEIDLDPSQSVEGYIDRPLSGWDWHPDDMSQVVCAQCSDRLAEEESERAEARR